MDENAARARVDTVIDGQTRWRDEFIRLRGIILESGLTETVKWGWPCYTVNDGNVVLIHGFKTYCALLFFKGALMSDPSGLLIRQTENVQAARQIRFTSLDEIGAREPVLKDYLREAIQIEESGRSVERKSTESFAIPAEFAVALEREPALQTAFESLTPGRQRAYLLYFASAKQPKTRQARVEKSVPRILDGLGLDD